MYINDTFVTQKIQGRSFGVNSVSFNPKNENQFVSCGNDSLIKKWEEKNNTWEFVDKIETDSIMKDVAYSDNESFASCSEDGSIILWTKEGNEWVKKILGMNENEIEKGKPETLIELADLKTEIHKNKIKLVLMNIFEGMIYILVYSMTILKYIPMYKIICKYIKK